MENIPRIGDKIINNKFIRAGSDQPASNSDEIAKSVPDSSNNELNNLQNDVQNSADSTEQKEYSLAQFKKDYKHIMRREVFPKLKPYEEKRIKYKSNLDKGVLGIILLIIAYVVWAVLLDYRISIELILGIMEYNWSLRKKQKKQIYFLMSPEQMSLLTIILTAHTEV